jgi:multidrug efflux pump subunit AcrB
VVLCLALAVIGIKRFRMPVDLFPPINMPEVVVATFYNGMPPVDIEVDITNPLERFFTQASGSITWSPARCWASASSRRISSPAPAPMRT